MSESVISKEVAIKEVAEFMESILDKKINLEDSDVLNEFEDQNSFFIKGVMDGKVHFNDEDMPILSLYKPLVDEVGNVICDEVSFLDRLTPSAQRKVTKGLDLKNDALTYMHKAMMEVSRFNNFESTRDINFLDRLSRKDMNLLTAICSTFLA